MRMRFNHCGCDNIYHFIFYEQLGFEREVWAQKLLKLNVICLLFRNVNMFQHYHITNTYTVADVIKFTVVLVFLC